MTGKSVAVTGFRKRDDGENKEVEISFQNRSDDLFYDFVNFYSGKKNLDKELLEIKPGEEKDITVKASNLKGKFKIAKDTEGSDVIFKEGEDSVEGKQNQEDGEPVESVKEAEYKKEDSETSKDEKEKIEPVEEFDGSQEKIQEEFNLFDKIMEGEKELSNPDVKKEIPDLSDTVEKMKEETLNKVEKADDRILGSGEADDKSDEKEENILQNLIEKVPGIARVEDVKDEALEDLEKIEENTLEEVEEFGGNSEAEKEVEEKGNQETEKEQKESEDRQEDIESVDEGEKPESNSLFTRLRHPFAHPEPEQESEEEASEQEEEDDEDEMLVTEKNNYSTERVTTGVINLDNKIEGGFVKGTMNLITGKTGTGKTAFCSNFILEGAKKGEPGVYVTTEEREEDILEDINAMFGWDFDSLAEQDKVRVLSIKPVFPSQSMDNISRIVRSYISELLDQVNEAIEEIDAERVVIDSVSLVQMFIQDQYMSRVALSSLMNNLREAGVTAVLVGSIPETSEGLSKEGIIEYLVDTVILLEFVPVAEDYNRTLKIRKMRRTDHETDIFPFEVTADGLKVHEAYESL